MKIAMLGHKRIPSREGGVEIVVEELATRMVGRGNEVTVYNRRGSHVSDKKQKIIKRKEHKGVRIVTVPTINKKGVDALLYSFFATIKAVFQKYDVLHYHAEGSCVMLLIPYLLHKRTVVTIHGLDWQRAKWGGFATRYLLLGEKFAAKYATEIIVLSRNLEKYFMDTYKRKVQYLPNGVNLPELRAAKIITVKYGLHKNGYFLFLARLVPEKGLHYLLEAFSELKTDKKLVIAGGSSHSDEYVEQINRMASRDKRVIMTGFVQGNVLEELFSNCLAYVLPSDVEGMPISLLEAMSYGCRCLVSNIDENVELVGEYAAKFQKSDIASLKGSLEHLLKEPECYQGESLKQVCLKQHNWEIITDKTLEIYNECLYRKK